MYILFKLNAYNVVYSVHQTKPKCFHSDKINGDIIHNHNITNYDS